MKDKNLIFTDKPDNKNWFQEKYYLTNGNLRYSSFQIVLNLLNQRHKNPTIIETGCQREENDIGAGMSTSIFAEYIYRYNGNFIIIDNNKTHLERSKKYLLKWPGIQTEFILSDSVEYLKKYNLKCDLLYLDSYDYPIEKIWERYGSKENFSKAVEIVSKKTTEELLQEFSEIIIPCQNHCLKEFQAVEDRLSNNTILLIDDNDLPGGGKPRLLKEYLLNKNWICLYDLRQTIWIKEL